MKVQFRLKTLLAAAGILVLAGSALPLRAYVTARVLSTTGSAVQQKWGPGAFPIQWRMNPTRGTNITGTPEQADIFRSSFAAWQAISTANIRFSEGTTTAASVKPGYDQVNLITTNVTVSDYSSAALGLTLVFSFDQGGVVDQFGRPVDFAGQIMEADIMFNPQEQFSTNAATPLSAVDLQSVATHEVGHLLGLDHTTLMQSSMFPTLISGANHPRALSSDDMAGVSTIYPSAAFSSKGTLSGTVRTTSNTAIFGAIVTAVNANGQPVASALTDPSGRYTIEGLDAGAYTLYAEPLDQPVTIGNLSTLTRINSGATVFTNFTTRFR